MPLARNQKQERLYVVLTYQYIKISEKVYETKKPNVEELTEVIAIL